MAETTGAAYTKEKPIDVEKADQPASPPNQLEGTDDLLVPEAQHEVEYRTLSWQQTALLLFGEYVCLAILALAWSWSVLGWVGGVLLTTLLGGLAWYTSYVLWEFCMLHPEVRDICDIAYILFGGKNGTSAGRKFGKIAYEVTAIMLLLNNIMLMGFHVFTGSKIFNTLSNHSQCTVVFTVITTLISIIVSLPRTLHHVAQMSVVSALSMGIALLLTWIYAGIEDHPTFGYGGSWPELGPVQTSAGAPPTTFVNGFNAMLNITFLWVGQILYPSFIAEMKRPEDFPKSLAALTFGQFALFITASAIGYYYTGQYATAPLIGSLTEPWAKKSAFAFVLLPTIIIASIYSNVAAKYLYRRILGPDSRHITSHSVIGWGVWAGIVVFIWVLAFIFGDVIPSMGDFLSILSAAFDSFFGFMFWSIAYFQMNRSHAFNGIKNITLSLLNVLIFLVGLVMLGPGLYTSIDAIITDYAGDVPQPFGCANNAL